jgi:hypothetical protein
VNDGRVELLPWISSEATQGRNLHLPNEVHSRFAQEVWDDGCKARKDTDGTNGHLDLNKGGKSVDQNAYRSMIGSLLYLCASRPDIMLSICMCARFQSDPKECHLVAVKRILRYLVSTPCFRIWYPKGSTFDLIGYSVSDYAGC